MSLYCVYFVPPNASNASASGCHRDSLNHLNPGPGSRSKESHPLIRRDASSFMKSVIIIRPGFQPCTASTRDMLNMSRFYHLNLLGFAVSNCSPLHQQYRHGETKQDEDSIILLPVEPAPSLRDGAISNFKWDYFPAYAFALAADWIQVRPHDSLQAYTSSCLLTPRARDCMRMPCTSMAKSSLRSW